MAVLSYRLLLSAKRNMASQFDQWYKPATMDQDQLKTKIEKAIDHLFESQPDIFEFTLESAQTEWNLAHHLACEIRQFFPGFDSDLDLRKPNAGNRRPDIVLHKRNTHKFNFLVIELKRDNEAAMEGEAKRIEEIWFAEPYLYRFGAAINLNQDHSYQVNVRANPNHPENSSGLLSATQ